MKFLKPFVAEPPEPALQRGPSPTVPETPEETLTLKQQFAELQLREDAPFKNALAVYPDDVPYALYISTRWPQDADVKALSKQLITDEEAGEMRFIASKADQARLAWNLANNQLMEPADRIKALELCGKITGTIEKPATVAINNGVVNNNRTMIVKDYGTNDEWEDKTMRQQARLKREVVTIDAVH